MRGPAGRNMFRPGPAHMCAGHQVPYVYEVIVCLNAALDFYRSLGATRYIREAESRLAGSA